MAGGVSCIFARGSPIQAEARVRSTPPWVATKTVFVATHGGVLLTLASLWMGLPLEKMHETPSATNSSITEVIYENGEFRIEKYSFDAHLGELRVENDMRLQ